jgi:hypothetical protein
LVCKPWIPWSFTIIKLAHQHLLHHGPIIVTSLHILTSLVAPSFSFIVQLQAMPNNLSPLPCFSTFVFICEIRDEAKKNKKKKEKQREIEKTKSTFLIWIMFSL